MKELAFFFEELDKIDDAQENFIQLFAQLYGTIQENNEAYFLHIMNKQDRRNDENRPRCSSRDKR